MFCLKLCVSLLTNSILVQRLDAIYEKGQEKRRDAREKTKKKMEMESKAGPKRQPKKTAAKSQKVECTTNDAFLKVESLKHCRFLITDEKLTFQGKFGWK
jgi:hypothetical protein